MEPNDPRGTMIALAIITLFSRGDNESNVTNSTALTVESMACNYASKIIYFCINYLALIWIPTKSMLDIISFDVV